LKLPNLESKEEVDYQKIMSKIFQDARTPFYEGCPISHLATILMLLNLLITHGVNNAFVDELFMLSKVDLFPKDNFLPKSLYHTKKHIQQLDLSYNSIHACYNGCLLFREDLNEAILVPSIIIFDI
jgi:hypothetical protein